MGMWAHSVYGLCGVGYVGHAGYESEGCVRYVGDVVQRVCGVGYMVCGVMYGVGLQCGVECVCRVCGLCGMHGVL